MFPHLCLQNQRDREVLRDLHLKNFQADLINSNIV